MRGACVVRTFCGLRRESGVGRYVLGVGRRGCCGVGRASSLCVVPWYPRDERDAGRTLSFAFQVVSSVTPPYGAHGTVITIGGSGFGSTRGTSNVTISGAQCLFAPGAWSPTSITCTVQYPVGGKSAVLVNVGGVGLSTSSTSVFFAGVCGRGCEGGGEGVTVFLLDL